jgi:hypothetical protein
MVFEAPSGQGVHAVAMQPQMPRGKLPYVVSDPRQQEALSRDAARRAACCSNADSSRCASAHGQADRGVHPDEERRAREAPIGCFVKSLRCAARQPTSLRPHSLIQELETL